MINLSEVKIKDYLFNRKVILGIVVAIIVGELVWAGWVLLKPSSTVTPGTSRTSSSAQTISKASITLQATKTNFKVGDKVAITVSITSSKPTAGADLVINFNPKTLDIDSKNASSSPMLTTSVYDDYPLNLFEPEGKILVSGISSADSGKVVDGVIGTINFIAKAAGKAKISVDFTKGSTVDSNVTEAKTAKDLLDEVNNIELNITQ